MLDLIVIGVKGPTISNVFFNIYRRQMIPILLRSSIMSSNFTNVSCVIIITQALWLGLTPNSEPAREYRTFPYTGTLNSPSSWDDSTECEISKQWDIC